MAVVLAVVLAVVRVGAVSGYGNCYDGGSVMVSAVNGYDGCREWLWQWLW